MAQRVKPDARETRSLGGGNEHSTAQTALIGRSTVAARNTNASSPPSHGRLARSIEASSGVSAITRAPCRDFGATSKPLTIARLTCRCGVSTREHEIAPAQPNRLGDPQPRRSGSLDLERRSPLRGDLVKQPHELDPRQVAPLTRRPCTPLATSRQDNMLGRVVVEQALRDGGVQREAQRRKRATD